ncbi:MAG TPA: hypothetical protein VFQ35_04990, partial [Polyangiaceae bacterium]|nr:hypothetical protein [Polyangiaceae bacterium]
MPSLDHELLIELFRNQPELAAQLLRDALHLELPAYTEARLASSDLTELVPTEFRADAVVLLVDGKPVLGVIVEAQLSRDERKRFTWPAYVSVLRARHQCPVELLVVTPDRAVATWASTPISLDLTGSAALRPRVLGPETIPIVTDAERAAREPEFAVLSLMAHGRDDTETAVSIALAAGHAVQFLSEDQRVLYLALIESALSDEAKKAFEMHPQSGKLISSWQRAPFEKARAAEKAADIIAVLEARGLVVSDAQRQRITETSDLDTLSRWVRRAATVTSTDALFE